MNQRRIPRQDRIGYDRIGKASLSLSPIDQSMSGSTVGCKNALVPLPDVVLVLYCTDRTVRTLAQAGWCGEEGMGMGTRLTGKRMGLGRLLRSFARMR